MFRSALQYFSGVWSPYYTCHIEVLEGVQVASLIIFGCGITLRIPSFTSMENHRVFYKFINYCVNSPTKLAHKLKH